MFKKALIFILFTSYQYGFCQMIKAYTTLVEPYAYLDESNNLSGLHKLLFEELEKRIGIPVEINVIPPARMKPTLAEGKNTIFYPMIRKEDRVSYLDWVFHVNTDHSQFIALKGKGIQDAMHHPSTIKDIKGVSIGVLRKSIFESLLTTHGVDPGLLSYAKSAKQNYDKLINGRIDYVFTSGTILISAMKHSEYGRRNLEYSKPLFGGLVYITGSKDFDEGLKEKIKAAYNEMLEDGTLKKMLDKYELKRTGAFDDIIMVNDLKK